METDAQRTFTHHTDHATFVQYIALLKLMHNVAIRHCVLPPHRLNKSTTSSLYTQRPRSDLHQPNLGLKTTTRDVNAFAARPGPLVHPSMSVQPPSNHTKQLRPARDGASSCRPPSPISLSLSLSISFSVSLVPSLSFDGEAGERSLRG